MPLPVINFAAIPPQGNSFARDFGQILQSGMMFPELLKQQQLANALSTLKNQYLPQQMQTEISLRQAQANRANNLANMPFGGQILPGPAGQIQGLELIGQQYGKDSPQYKKAVELYNLNKNAIQNRGLGVGGREDTYFQNIVAQDNPNLTPEQQLQAVNIIRSGGNTLPDGTTLNISPRAIDSMDRMIGYGATTAQRNQRLYAYTLDELIKKTDKNAIAASDYSGFFNKSKGNAQKAIAMMTNENPKSLEKYNQFIYQDVPSMAGEYMRNLGVNASDQQKNLYMNVVNPNNWLNNPKQALSNWNHFKELAKTTSKAVSQSPSIIKQKLSTNESNQSNKSNEMTYNPVTGRLE